MSTHFFMILIVLWATLGAPAAALTHERRAESLDEFVAGVTVPNVREKVRTLARRVASNEVTVEEFADFYFRRTADGKASPQLRRRFIANMRQNLRIVGRAGRGVPAAEAIRAERSLETVLFRLQRAPAGGGGVLPARSSAGKGPPPAGTP